MTGLRPGSSLDIWEGDEVRAVALVGEDRGKLRVVTPEGREMRVPEARVANVGGLAVDPTISPVAIGKLLQAHEVELKGRAQGVDLQALWEVLTDEGGQYSLEELAELALGSRDGLSRSAVLRRLVGDTLYFARRKLLFAPRSREDLGETVRRLKREDERARSRAEFVATARAFLAKPIEPSPEWPRGSERFLEALRDVAVRGAESERTKEAEALLADLGHAGRGDPALVSFEILVKLHVFAPDENLLLARHAVRREFPPEILAEAERMAARTPLPSEPWRRDLRELETYAIDDPETTEVDDALSLGSPAPGLLRLGVHIADPSPWIAHLSPLDLDARERATTFYLPEERILMLPPVLAEGVASLHAGETRPALSFLLDLDPSGALVASAIVPSIIRVTSRLSYEQADALIALGGGAPRLDEPSGSAALPLSAAAPPSAGAPPVALPSGLPPGAAVTLASAARLAHELLERRAAAGALILKGPDLDVKVRAGQIRLRRLEPWTPAWVLVSEAMIAANAVAASFLAERGIPAIYRRQPPPDQKIELPRAYDPAAAAAARRVIKRTEVGLTPGPHAGLGLKLYLQVTSPLRRYQDLACHRQIRAALLGEPPPFDAEALWRVAATTDEAERTAREVERGTREYWLLRHLESLPPLTVLEATVTRPDERRTLIELTDYVYVTALVPRTGHKPGRKLRVVIEAVHPRAGRLVVREV